MKIFIDITSLEKGRANTGIQRVVKEYIKRALEYSSNIQYEFLIHKEKLNFYSLNIEEVKSFLNDFKNFQFSKQDIINFDFYKKSLDNTLFFDIDSNWNQLCKRSILYSVLKKYEIYIINFVYDLIPIILPEYTHENTAKNYKEYLRGIYEYSDLVLFDSQSACDDFYNSKGLFNCKRDISTRVVPLGSDFTNIEKLDYNLDYNPILSSKYILFVGTIEPRKSQDEVLNAFEELSSKYKDLNLVFIGKKGWYVDSLIEKINNHDLKDKRLFWFDNVDDNTLKAFYKNAYIVTYISKYEGYGLPIAESLAFGNITITSKNSSMYEVAQDSADYIIYNSLNELASLLSLYISNDEIYNAKKEYIKNNFTTPSWDKFYSSIAVIFDNFEKSKKLSLKHLNKLQFVFISIDNNKMEDTIKSIDENCDFIKEYIVVTSSSFVDSMKKIASKYDITVIDENMILENDIEYFQKSDHQMKNWLLRISLLNIEILEEEFIMLDDDNRVIKKISIDKFIDKNGKYNAYYFHNLLEWKHYNTDYDFGQVNTKNLLVQKNYEFLSYSSHAPQIINKSLLKEIKDEFYEIGKEKSIDEWSIYFNVSNSKYPYLFNKKPFETICWPIEPASWEAQYKSDEITFENYYKETYDLKYFDINDTYEEKVKKFNNIHLNYKKTNEHFKSYYDILVRNNMVHKYLHFNLNQGSYLYLFSLPYFLILESNSDLKLRINYKLINKTKQCLDISIVTFLNEDFRSIVKLPFTNNNYFQDNFFELNVNSKNLEEGVYNLYFDVMVSDKYSYDKKSPYVLKLYVIKDKNPLEAIQNPTIHKETIEKQKESNMKNRIKSIPIIGWFVRWSYNLLRLNHMKYIVYKQQEHMKYIIYKQQEHINKLEQEIAKINNDFDKRVSKELSFQVDSFEQRIEQFIFDAKQELEIKNEKD